MGIRSAKELFRSPKMECKLSTVPGGGMGVFATEDIKAGELLEVCQFLIFGYKEDREKYSNLFLDYRFWFDKNKLAYAIVLGWGSMFNSSEDRNAIWLTPDNASELLSFKVDGKMVPIRRIPSGFF
jgi:hypothetical protein